jgi:hypothetical protein
MTMLTLEYAKRMSNEELHTLVSDWFKDVNGFRPRHISIQDREAMLNFIEYELRPDIQAMRNAEWDEQEKWFEDMNAKLKEEEELNLAYDDRYDHFVKQ